VGVRSLCTCMRRLKQPGQQQPSRASPFRTLWQLMQPVVGYEQLHQVGQPREAGGQLPQLVGLQAQLLETH
jgi:hypothetical protein